MTVSRLLTEADSRELTMWQVFFAKRAETVKEQREADQLEAELTRRG